MVTYYSYDLRGRLVRVSHDEPSCDQIRYEYDQAGRKTAVIDHGTSSYQYDVLGRLIQSVDSMGNRLRYGYDANGNMTTLTMPEGAWQYAYDRSNRMVSVTDPAGLKATYTYTANGQPARVDLPYGIYVQNTYDPQTNRLMSRQYTQPGATSPLSYSYQYDAKGNVTMDGSTTTYTYDALDRLTQVNSSATAYTYIAYDAVGNMLIKGLYSGATGLWLSGDRFGYDAANRTTAVSRDPGSGGTMTVERYVYDTAGRLIMSSAGSAVTQYDYNSFDRLIRQTTGSLVTSYGYDGEGHRLFRKVLDRTTPTNSSQIYYQYLGGQVVAERDATGALVTSVTRGLGGELLTLSRTKGTFVFATDRLGSVRSLLDNSFTGVATYSYDAFGVVTASTGGLQNDWKFTGAIYDGSSNLYHLGARYYKPTDGRFITQDTWKGSPWQPWTQNLYAYVGNNPVNYVDPTGHNAKHAEDGGSSRGRVTDEWTGPSWQEQQIANCKEWWAGYATDCESLVGQLKYQVFGTVDYYQEEYPWTVDAAGVAVLVGGAYEGWKSSGLSMAEETGAIKIPNWKDASSKELVRFAENMGLNVEAAGKHLKVYDSSGNFVTLIPHSAHGNFTVKSIIEAIQRAGQKP